MLNKYEWLIMEGRCNVPKANYCRKCKAEVPSGESCPYCGGKLTQTGERISFGSVITPVRDWFAWNGLLRLGLTPLAIICVIVPVAELISGGINGFAALIGSGFLWTVLCALALMLLAILVLLILQGREHVHYVIDKDGVRALCYLIEPRIWQLYARFITPAAVSALAQSGDNLEGFTLVRRISLPWSEIRRLRFWREDVTLLFYRPSFWLALAMRCPPDDFALAEAYARKKLKRFKNASIPPEK